jgi:4-amino-4-deoxy-L-arabinose transferase-like glycosyltransferase
VTVLTIEKTVKSFLASRSHALQSGFKRSSTFVFAAIVTVGIAARLWRITAYSLGADEIFSLQTARQGWIELLRSAVGDVVHPPMFYLLLKVWIGLGGDSEPWLRLLPVLTAVAAILPFMLLCRELRLDARETNLALILIAINGYLIYYAQELRMYSLLLFLTLWSLWAFVRVFNAAGASKTQWTVLLAINLLLVHAHYYGWIVIGVQAVSILIWQRHKFRRFLFGVCIWIMCALPWIYLVSRASAARGGLESNIGSFSRPAFINDVVGYYAMLNGRFSSRWLNAFGLVLFGYPIVSWGWRSLKRTQEHENSAILGWLMLLSFSAPVLVYLISQVYPQSVWGTRFLISATVPYFMLVSLAIYRLRSGWIRTATAIFVAVWAALAGFHELNNSGRYAWEPLVRQMIGEERSQAHGIMVYGFGSSDEEIQFYLDKHHEDRFMTRRITEFIKDANGDHFWVASRESEREWPQAQLVSRGYQVGEGFTDAFGARLFPVWRDSALR